MADAIYLHDEKGINARLTFCITCGGETNELALLGNRNYKETCNSCGMVAYGGMPKKGGRKECPSCEHTGFSKTELDDYERTPASEPCAACKKDILAQKAVVSAGGIYFKCADCNAHGAIKADHELSKHVRKELKVNAPDPVGVEFTSSDCPVCSDQAKEAKDAEM